MELRSKPRVDELLRSLPSSCECARAEAPRDQPGSADQQGDGSVVSYAEASLTLDAALTTSLLGLASGLLIPPEKVLLAGYAALLFRLSAQEMVALSLAPASYTLGHRVDATGFESCVFGFGERASFRDAAVHGKVGPAEASAATLFCFGKHALLPAREREGRAWLLDGFALLLGAVHEDGADGDRVTLSMSSSSGLWTNDTLQSWLAYLENLLRGASFKPTLPVSQLPLLGADALREAYAHLNETTAIYSRDLAVDQLFAEQAARSPENIAVISLGERLTYRELDQQSSSLAARLRAMGAGRDRPVGICLERSTRLSVALLGVLKSGSCYVPLDPQHPAERLAGILDECKPVAVITEGRLAHVIAGNSSPTLLIDAAETMISEESGGHIAPDLNLRDVELREGSDPDSLAYIIFTSGTTGKPKGVSIAHGALTNLLTAMKILPGMGASDRLLALATISFDMAVVDMFLPLVTGGTLVIAERSAVVDPFALAQLLQEHDITCMQATPTTWKMLTETGWRGKRDLRALCGGEALPMDLAKTLLPLVGELWNCYGPTETTVWSAFLRIDRTVGAIVPVGPPLANTTFYVMNDAGSPVPPGVPGELFIGGDGVARGYFEQPELTVERFVPDRNSGEPASRLFRTGDLVRLLENGTLEFFGRIDHQVKLRGFRIELEEIEATLREDNAVASAVVVLRSDETQEPRLVAYVVPSGTAINLSDLRESCGRRLPAYMIPSEFVRLSALPLTPSGKVDRKALPAPVSDGGGEHRPVAVGAPPRDELEAKLLAIFRDVLGQTAVGSTDSFFDYGGYSLLAVKLFTRINKALRLSLPISLLFDAPSVQRLAEVIRSGVQPPVIVPIRRQGSGTPLFVIHSYLLYAVLPQVIEAMSPIYGIRENAGDRALHSVEERARLYAREVLKVSPQGPFYLAGWCAAGSLTVEVARQLQSMEHRVDMVALFDGERPGFDERASGPRVGLGSRLLAAYHYHRERIRFVPPGQRPAYFGDVLLRRLDAKGVDFFTRHKSFVASLERRFRGVLPGAIFDNMWNTNAAVQDDVIKPYNGSLTLFRAADVPGTNNPDETLGWRDVALGGVEVIFVPGDHESMFRQPQLGTFGEKLRQVMAGDRSKLAHR